MLFVSPPTTVARKRQVSVLSIRPDVNPYSMSHDSYSLSEEI